MYLRAMPSRAAVRMAPITWPRIRPLNLPYFTVENRDQLLVLDGWYPKSLVNSKTDHMLVYRLCPCCEDQGSVIKGHLKARLGNQVSSGLGTECLLELLDSLSGIVRSESRSSSVRIRYVIPSLVVGN